MYRHRHSFWIAVIVVRKGGFDLNYKSMYLVFFDLCLHLKVNWTVLVVDAHSLVPIEQSHNVGEEEFFSLIDDEIVSTWDILCP